MDTREPVTRDPTRTFAAPGHDVGGRHAQDRWHRLLAHTADVGFRAAAPNAAGLFEEAAAALAELSADVHGTEQLEPQPIGVAAADLTELMFRWLNELIGLAEVRGQALVRADASRVEADGPGWAVNGTAWFAPFDGTDVRPRLQVKAATLHRLRVVPARAGWRAEAYVDI